MFNVKRSVKILTARADRDELNEAYHLKLEENEKMAMERTEKKRKKRQKKKGKKKKGEKEKEEKESSDDDDEDEEEEEEKEPTAESQITNIEPEKAPAEPTSSEKKKKDMVLVFYS